ISFVKNVMDNDRLVEVNNYFKELATGEGFYSEELMEKIAEKGNLKDIDEVPSRYRRIFVTAHEISPKWHVRTQAAFQKFVDNAVSKTVNFPNSATVQDVENVYILAYRLGCKGITIFRDKSRGTQVLQVEGKKKEEEEGLKETAELKEVKEKIKSSPETEEKREKEVKEVKLKPRSRPEVTHGMTKKYKIGNCGKLYVTVNSDENGICEVFINTGEEGCTALTEAVGRLISIAIRSGIDIESVKKQVVGIRCITCIADKETHILSCPDAMGKAIDFYLNGSNKFDLGITSGPRSIMICPEDGCGGIMEPEGGCYICRNCGFSKCS
ncbi:MAG TPA: TSCPD domain-containing protein, partial [Candidatus Hydromicrobium sp.]